MVFKLHSKFKPTGDQPQAIKSLVDGIKKNEEEQVLLGVTGSGKTYTIANVIKQVQKPTLILSHNKTLAAQLYGEFKDFFPENAVEYFVSYYDYYQPEAYIPSTNTYIEKDLSINDEIEKLRLSTTSSLLSGRNDIIVVSSVSCIYGIGNPKEFRNNSIQLKQGQICSINSLLQLFVSALYSRVQNELIQGNFRVKGDIVDIFPAYTNYYFKIHFLNDEIEEIERINPEENTSQKIKEASIYPANIFVASPKSIKHAIKNIRTDLGKQINYFESIGKPLEAKRIEERVNFDLEMMQELGYCAGIENYSRYLDRRSPGERPFCLFDYFPNDFLLIIDESHVTIPQLKGMHAGDRSRKINLVEYGFRLPAALDNRPLHFEEFNTIKNKCIYMSATPADYELSLTGGVFTEQIIRPTGLLDPIIELRETKNQLDDLMEEIQIRIEKKQRVLVTTLTKRMAEELSKHLYKFNIKCNYIHSEVDTLKRIEILRDLRLGHFDVLVGVNLLREGLDLPEVSLVAILDADKEGFLRSEKSLTQTAGRAARHIEGKVIMYGDKVTKSMQKTIDKTNRRRSKQIQYNKENNIIPKSLIKSKQDIIKQSLMSKQKNKEKEIQESINKSITNQVEFLNHTEIKKIITNKRHAMELAAKELDFLFAARLRDEIKILQKKLS